MHGPDLTSEQVARERVRCRGRARLSLRRLVGPLDLGMVDDPAEHDLAHVLRLVGFGFGFGLGLGLGLGFGFGFGFGFGSGSGSGLGFGEVLRLEDVAEGGVLLELHQALLVLTLAHPLGDMHLQVVLQRLG